MTGYFILIAAFVLIALSLLGDRWRTGQWFCTALPQPFRSRESQEAAWRQACADEQIEQVDELLEMLCDSFLFNPEDRFRFSPDDRIGDIYRACYPKWQFWKLGDCMELEELIGLLENRMPNEQVKDWANLTLAEMVHKMKPLGHDGSKP